MPSSSTYQHLGPTSSPFEPPASPPISRPNRTYGGNAAFHNFHNDYSHIPDPNQRRRLALSEIDKVPFGWYHVRAVIVAGIGFFTDSYDIFAINMIAQMLGLVFWQNYVVDGVTHGNNGNMPTSASNAIKVSASAGAVAGQLFFGWLADKIGRRVNYGIELAIIIFSTLAQSLTGSSPSMSITNLFIFWRVIMGFGIGGDYPMSSVITSEFAPTRYRGAMMAAVFSMQGAGQFAAALVALIVTAGFQESFINIPNFSACDHGCQQAADECWRIIVGFGAVPAIFALYYRITIPETPRYTFDVAHDIEKADADIQAYLSSAPEGQPDELVRLEALRTQGPGLAQPKASLKDFVIYFSQWRNGILLLGTTSTWFLLDFAYYGLSLNNSSILEAIGYSSGPNVYTTLYNTAVGNLILVCAGAIPGYWLTVLLVDRIGRRPIQCAGFFLLTVIFCIIGFTFHALSPGALLGLYILAQLFFNFGPNATTFIIPGECFPTRYRSTAHGLSAAAGKMGAIVSQLISLPLMDRGAATNCKGSACSPWLNHLMQIFALVMCCGLIVSILCTPETRRLTLEELAGEEGDTGFKAGGGAGGGMVGIAGGDDGASTTRRTEKGSLWKRLVGSRMVRGPGRGVLVADAVGDGDAESDAGAGTDNGNSTTAQGQRRTASRAEKHARSFSAGTYGMDGYSASVSDGGGSMGKVMGAVYSGHDRSESIPLQDVGSLLAGMKMER